MSKEFTEEDHKLSESIYEKIMDIIRQEFKEKKNSMSCEKLTCAMWSAMSNVVAGFITSISKGDPSILLTLFYAQIKIIMGDVKDKNKLN